MPLTLMQPSGFTARLSGAALKEAPGRIRRSGKAAGILNSEADCAVYLEAGASVLALGSDPGLLVRAADTLAEPCRSNPARFPSPSKAKPR